LIGLCRFCSPHGNDKVIGTSGPECACELGILRCLSIIF
jgi:hypothetical protein